MSRDLKTNIDGVVTVCISRYDITIYVYQRLCKFSNLEISNLVKKTRFTMINVVTGINNKYMKKL